MNRSTSLSGKAITMKIKSSKRFGKKAAATAVLVLGLTTLGAVQAKALDLKSQIKGNKNPP